ncbi:MAG: Eco57I restriction-modification methylase domain-containing protein [Pelodictyon phaeoclathratiforme]|nr:Eco57I restriction-modification methylase domain-containing protein [Pelodictyon phaeoclathratiforme]
MATTDTEIKFIIERAIKAFSSGNLTENSLKLFQELGYNTNRQQPLPEKTFACFKEYYIDTNSRFNEEKSLATEWQQIDLLFQLTKEEVTAQNSLFNTAQVDRTIIEAYLFFCIELNDREYTRTALSQITREINKAFKMPVMVLFKLGDKLSLAVINRRLHKKDPEKDVLEKVTLIKDINIPKPHRAHIEILFDLCIEKLRQVHKFTSFVELHEAWSETLDTKELNNRFYTDLSNWYFWVRDSEDVVFPKDVKSTEDRALFLIRFLTRFIFCWFLRKKRNPGTGQSLLPQELFKREGIGNLLLDASPGAYTYYPAILQNLFFATLNTEMDKQGFPHNRRFIDEGDGRSSDDHMIHSVWRNAHMLQDPEGFARLLRQVPFLNGGLFECLDDRVTKGKSNFTEEIRIDGFSNIPKKHPKLPNYIFFGDDQRIDLSDAYGDTNRRRETVRPLLTILSSYNFTLTENTPLEQEIALDPELLGHVFENLLAAYNPETGTVARKSTGSFYTPRVVVDWMADQALAIHLNKALSRLTGVMSERTDPRLKMLLSWEEAGLEFSDEEKEALIDAIDSLKVLDPACGSGAFPMGVLQKLVHVLRKLDPENRGWRRRQEAALERIESATAREEARLAIERAFAHDNDDYGRKLYLIENCLYGVDILPIACQLAKLRFFIALIVDQEIDDAYPNYGILPLPNLETKIVAANTLLGLQRRLLLLANESILDLETELQQVRHNYFTARRYKDKKALRARDKELCDALAEQLAEAGGLTPYDTQRIASWNPYKTNVAAAFFDPAWMFGLVREGGSFDIVIGNPPYVRQEQLRNMSVTGSGGQFHSLKEVLKEQYECYTGTADLYVYFFERALQLLRIGGTLAYITSNKYMRAAYGEKLRTYLACSTRPHAILDFGDAPVFTAIAYPCIMITEKTLHVEKGQLPSASGLGRMLSGVDSTLPVFTWKPCDDVTGFPEIFESHSHSLAQRDLKSDGWRLESPVRLRLLERLRLAGTPLDKSVQGRFYRGILTGLNEAFVVDRDTYDRLIAAHPSSAEVLKPFLRGRDVKKWRCEFQDRWLIKIGSSENERHLWSGESEREAERKFANIYPAIHGWFEPLRDRLIQRYDKGRYFWELRSCDYWREFEQPKIIVPAIEDDVNYAPDAGSFYGNDKTSILIPSSVPFTIAILNSTISWWITRQEFASRQGGYYEFKPMYVSRIPIPNATPNQQHYCELLADALIWLYSPNTVSKKDDMPLSLMKAYFEQWLNGLVYELFFPDELHSRKIKLFAETVRFVPPDFSTLSEEQRIKRLSDSFEKAYDSNATIRSMLFDLRSLEVVRIIEEPTERNAMTPLADL